MNGRHTFHIAIIKREKVEVTIGITMLLYKVAIGENLSFGLCFILPFEIIAFLCKVQVALIAIRIIIITEVFFIGVIILQCFFLLSK